MSVSANPALPRLALISRRYWPQMGGAETVMANLASEFAQRGHATTVVTAQWEPHWPIECVHREVNVIRLPQPQVRGWGTIRYLHALRRWLHSHQDQFDAVLVSTMRHDAYAAVHALGGTRVPVIVRAHGAGETGDLAWQRTARFGSRIKKACLRADAIIAPSPFTASELQHGGYPAEHVHCVFNGVPLLPQRDPDQKLFARLAVSDANLAMEMVPDAPLVVYIGRLHESKGLKDLVYAWVKIAERRPNARLWMIGEGPFRDSVYDAIVDLSLHHQVFLPGAFDDVTDVLAAADLFVHPSYEEGTSVAILEAMSAAVPVIATDNAGNRGLITHEEHGLLVPPHDPAALRGAIVRLLDDRECAEHFGQRARERMQAEFTLSRMADQHLEVVQQAIAARAK